MPWPLPALGTTGCAAYDLDVAAASCARCPAFAWPPVDDHRAWLPGVPEAALLWEARKRVTWLFHELYSNIRSINLEDTMTLSMRTTGNSVGGGRTRRVGGQGRSVAVASLRFGCCTIVLHVGSLILTRQQWVTGYSVQAEGTANCPVRRGGGQPEKRKVGCSTPTLTTSHRATRRPVPDRMPSAAGFPRRSS
jgi:hypothetical protein